NHLISVLALVDIFSFLLAYWLVPLFVNFGPGNYSCALDSLLVSLFSSFLNTTFLRELYLATTSSGARGINAWCDILEILRMLYRQFDEEFHFTGVVARLND